MERHRANAADVASLPSVDRLLRLPAVAGLIDTEGRGPVTAAVRNELEVLRARALAGGLDAAALDPIALTAAIAHRIETARRPRLRRVYNLTGTVLHTNLGRALLPASAVEAVVAAMQSPVTLEYDLEDGRRGDRDSLVAPLLAELSGAEAATVVNNCAAALVLTLGVLASRREVIVSRGELIEIGGSFRLPDLMRAAGVRLVEVGTTNRTHVADYRDAIGARTGLILKVHPSNYVISGFTSGVNTRELAALARAHELPLVVDIGSGALIDLKSFGLPEEPVVAETIANGADLVLFSGDKLLGGPQAGLIVGREALIRRLKRHPLKRALRPGKLTLAALESVLLLYRAPEHLAVRLPTLAQLVRPAGAIAAQATRVQPLIAQALEPDYVVAVESVQSQIGSGAQPGAGLPSYALAVRAAPRRRTTPARLARKLRGLERPVIGRVSDDALYLDLRCLEPADEAAFCAEIGHLRA